MDSANIKPNVTSRYREKTINVSNSSGIPRVVEPLPSKLLPDRHGKLSLDVIQAACGKNLIGDRLAIQKQSIGPSPSIYEVEDCRKILSSSRPGSLTVISFHPGLRSCEAELKQLSQDRTIVGLAGDCGNGTNVAYIATGNQLYQKAKLSLSSEDLAQNFQAGSHLPVFTSKATEITDPVVWSVLNCHDYTHVDLLRAIQACRIELLVVVTYNAATRLFWEYAIADIHRLFCYVVIVNVAEIGGSAVFAPFRSLGQEKNARFGAGGQVFGVRGPSTLRVPLTLDIAELRRLRNGFSDVGFEYTKITSKEANFYEPIQPSEHFLATFDRQAGPPVVKRIVEYPFEWNFSNPCIALAQLNSMSLDTYLNTKYRIRNDLCCDNFQALLSIQLSELEYKCKRERQSLDLLILPEVFVPRSFISILQAFSDRVGAIVVAGIDYPDGGEDENANECIVLRPGVDAVTYRKITRSQYDALKKQDQRMPMRRGSELIRFVNNEGRGIGVLICYDYSHLDLMWEINLRGRKTPLDLIIVVAHNPYSTLYRSCCIADAHRFYQYIAMCNVSRYGGSGVFGPVRTPGARQVLLEAGKAVETIAVIKLDMTGLSRARETTDQELNVGEYMRRPGVFQSRWPVTD